MAVQPHSNPPNVGNYFIGRGYATVQLQTDVSPHDLGNITLFEFEVKPTLLPHYSSRIGVRKKDFVATTQLEATLRISMEEIIARNLALLLLGTVTGGGGGAYNIQIMSEPQIYCSFNFFGTNSVGAQWNAHFPLVLMTPQRAIALISAGTGEWGSIELQGDVLFDDHSQSFGYFTSSDIVSP